MLWYELLTNLFVLTIMLVGLVGIVHPFFPGIHLIWFGVFLHGVVTQFRVIDISYLALTSVLVLLTYALDYWSSRWGLRELKVTWLAVVGAVVGGLVGSFFGLFQALTVGPLLGAVVGEMLSGRDSVFFLETNEFKLVGYVGSTLLQVVMGLIIIGTWFAKAW